MTPEARQQQAREAARYIRDLASRLIDYPTDHYREAADALIAYAEEEEANAAALDHARAEARRELIGIAEAELERIGKIEGANAQWAGAVCVVSKLQRELPPLVSASSRPAEALADNTVTLDTSQAKLTRVLRNGRLVSPEE